MPKHKPKPEPLPLGARIRAARQAAGLTQQELADQAGLPQSRISAFERGAREPLLPHLQAIAAALKLSSRDLLGW
jgi:transcriptional regulator with XRE-family HTH domain